MKLAALSRQARLYTETDEARRGVSVAAAP